MIKIYKNYDTSFNIPVSSLDSLLFVYHTTGSLSITGSFTNYGDYTTVAISGLVTATMTTGSANVFAITDNIPTPVDTATISDITTVTLSHAETVLSAIEAVIESRATKEQSELTIAGRQVKYIALTELLKLRQEYKKLVEQEKIENGLKQKTGMKILTRWG